MSAAGQSEEGVLALLEEAAGTEALEEEDDEASSLDAELPEVGVVPPLLPQAVNKKVLAMTLVPNKIREINMVDIPADKSRV